MNNYRNRKGIILAGGKGSRLHPLTLSVSKQLLPIYDKPMIYYPISNLLMAGIREILIICDPFHIDYFKKLIKDGSQWGVKIEYITQPSPNGIAESFILGEDFLGGDSVCLILGDNLFYGDDLSVKLKNASQNYEFDIIQLFRGFRIDDP